tara:strand:+ start:223 stop:717 length:495 start_codon:yes stop_codon:yes gene_type:complete
MPQLNPEFFLSQLFWLVLTFSFLLIFLWRISLPRISSVLNMRETKISEDIESAKTLQKEAEEIQAQIESELKNANEKNKDLIKSAIFKLQESTTSELSKIDKEINNKINDSEISIQNNKKRSLDNINQEIYVIAKLALSKISSISVDEKEIKDSVDSVNLKIVN